MDTLVRALDAVEDIQPIIDHIEATDAEAWQLDVVRSGDGSKNCFFGHLYQWAESIAEQYRAGDDTEKWANRIWEAFEERWATTFMVYPVNDGTNPGYPQPTARERTLALLRALRDGEELTTYESMEAEMAAIEEAERADLEHQIENGDDHG